MPGQTCERVNCQTPNLDVQQVTVGLQPLPMLTSPLHTWQTWLCVNHRTPPAQGLVSEYKGVPCRIVVV